MKGFRRPRSPALVLLLLRPLLASGDSASRPQARAMNPGGCARGSPEDSHRLLRTTVPGSDPQRRNELLLLMAGEGAAAESRHHVLYFPGDVQVTRARPPRHAHAGPHTGVRGARVTAGAPPGEGGPGWSPAPESSCQSRCCWVEGEARQGMGHARTAPAWSQRILFGKR